MTANDDVLAAVGPRLRALRREHETTLAALSDITGISVSTLSRLESGQRRATLELLLPLAQAYRVPLDELVGAPATGDPRIYARPIKHRNGQTIIPLSRQATGLQAFKILIPAGPPQEPDPQTHEGYEWLYVLSGRLRIVLGDHDLILPAGEAAEFDTRIPHWFGSAAGAARQAPAAGAARHASAAERQVGEAEAAEAREDAAEEIATGNARAGKAGAPVEILTIFGPQGERMHVRARPSTPQNSA